MKSNTRYRLLIAGGAALSLLPIQSGGRLLENIVYLGLPAVFAAVRAGKFQNTSLRIPGKEIKA
jgi:hypothetical protein